MSSLFGLNKPNTNLRKNVFDLSEKTLFSMAPGMLLPCMVKDMNPGEKAKIQMSAFTRTQPLNTAAFVRTRQYFHFFFVPYKQLWSGWDNFINGVNYRTSSFQDGKRYDKVPRLELFKVLSNLLKDGYIIDKNVHSKIVKENSDAYTRDGSTFVGRYYGGPVRYDQDAKLPAALRGRGPRKRHGQGDTVDPIVRGDGLHNVDNDFDLLRANFGYGKDEFGYDYYLGISRLLDMLGYGFVDGNDNVGQYMSSLSDMITAIENPALDTGDIDVLCRDLVDAKFSVNPFRLLAYQKIYSDFYKRDDYEATEPLSFNIDDVDDFIPSEISGATAAQRVKVYKRLLGMLRLRYRWLPKDYFTGVVPSELYNVENSVKFLYSEDGERDFEDRAKGLTKDDYIVRVGDHRDRIELDGQLSTKSIRASFAIEKLLRLTRRAGGYDYISQTAAHYGFEPPKGRGDKVEFLGGYSSNINVSEVITTANTDQGATGQTYGKGVGGIEQGKDIEFTAKEHGVLMCITSIVPDLDYSAEGLDRFNAKFERGDYFHPEFQDLGLQPVFGYELKNPWRLSDDQSMQYTSPEQKRNSVLGFVPMYSEYKTSYDKLHGEFRNGKSLSAWSGSQMVDYSWNDPEGYDGVEVSTLLINPRCLNRVFAVNFNGRENTDNFMVNAQFVVKIIRPMSITGQNL